MKNLLALLVSASIIHQTNHWNSKGSSFYEDHLLFERLYNEVQDGIDSVAEKIIGLKIESKIDSKELSENVAKIVDDIGEKNSSKEIEVLILNHIESQLKSKNISPGLANLLGDLHDKHEKFIYLLNQRTASVKNIFKLAQEYEAQATFNSGLAAKQIQQAMSNCSQALGSIDFYSEADLYKIIEQANGYLDSLWKTSTAGNFQPNLEVSLPRLKQLLAMSLEKATGPARNQLMTAYRIINSVVY